MEDQEVLLTTVFGLLVCLEEVLLELTKLCGDSAHLTELGMVRAERTYWKERYSIE